MVLSNRVTLFLLRERERKLDVDSCLIVYACILILNGGEGWCHVMSQDGAFNLFGDWNCLIYGISDLDGLNFLKRLHIKYVSNDERLCYTCKNSLFR